METKVTKVKAKGAAKNASIRIRTESRKIAKALLAEVNNKKFGRNIKIHELFELAIGLVTQEHLKILREKSITPDERMEKLRQKYVETRGAISAKEFKAFMTTAEYAEFLLTHSQVLHVA